MTINITVIGSGYVGVVTASCLAEIGNKVIGYDIDKEKISKLKNAEVPFFEPELQELIESNINKNLSFSNNLSESLKNSDICFIAVGTPHDESNNSPNLSFFYDAIDQILDNITKDLIIVNKSTLPIGTAQKLSNYIKEKNISHQISVVSNPEFLSQGSAVNDFMNPRRIVIGTSKTEDLKLLRKVYDFFIKNNTPFIETDIASAELIKYASNGFLAMKVAFINEIATISQNIGADINDISSAMGLDERIGNKFLASGPGYGGSCFPKDSKALASLSKDLNLELPLVKNIDLSNEKTISFIVKQITKIIAKHNAKTISICGLSFKANTDDLRDSQGIKIIQQLRSQIKNLQIYAHDPIMIQDPKLDKVIFDTNLETIISKGEIVCFVTEWNDYKNLSSNKLKQKIIIDLRNLFPDQQNNDNYYGIKKWIN